MKKRIIALSLLMSFNVFAEVNKIETEEYTLEVHDSVSGGIISVFNMLKGTELTKKEIVKEVITEKVVEYKEDPETAKKLAEFKNLLNAKLQSDKLMQTFHFKTASSELSEQHSNYLTNIILNLNNYKNLNYEIIGYSDARGNAEYNQKLSEQRANSVLDILKSLGIDNVSVKGFGESKSSASKSREDFFFDRKVELIIKK
jgi:outer membrane protein OmpA-like peptidoglycan-associated protein